VKQVKIFASTATNTAYADVQKLANKWLAEHPRAAIITSHTNLAAESDFTEFALTLIVDMPERSSEGEPA